MSLQASVGLALLLGSGRAMADRAIAIDVGSPLVFDAAELAAALRVRIARTGTPVLVRVIPTGEGVVVEINGSTRNVALGGRSGAEAARLVALAASDLLLSDLAMPPEIEAPATWAFDAVGSVAAWDHAFGGAAIEATLANRDWVAIGSLGGGELLGSSVALAAGFLRIGAGRRFAWIDLVTDVVIAPTVVTRGVGDATVLIGGGFEGRVRLPIGSHVHCLLAGGIDAFATRTEYTLGGMAATATPWWALWAGIGIEVAP